MWLVRLQFPNQGSNPHPQQWKHRALTTAREFPKYLFSFEVLNFDKVQPINFFLLCITVVLMNSLPNPRSWTFCFLLEVLKFCHLHFRLRHILGYFWLYWKDYILLPLNYFSIFVKKKKSLTINIKVYIWTFSFVSLVYMLILVPVLITVVLE